MSSDIDDTSRVAIGDGYFISLMRHAAVAFLGAVFAVILYKVWSLESRWFYIVIVAILLLSVSAMAVSKFSKFLLVMLMFGLPFAGFGKWLFVGSYSSEVVANQVYAGLISIGIYDFLLIGLYMSWFFRVVISREQKPPGIRSMDLWVIGIVLSYIISIPGSIEPQFGYFSLVHLLKHVAFYFYVTRNFQYRHVKWFLAAMAFAVCVNALLGGYQKLTGNLIGIALDKGAGSSELNSAYTVYQLDAFGSTGTSYDSHALGMLMAIAIQFCLVLLFRPNMRLLSQGKVLTILGLAALTMLFSYSRTAWFGCLGASGILFALVFFRWRETRVFSYIGVFIFILLIFSPWLAEYIIDRFDRGTNEVLDLRMEQWAFAVDIWLQKPFFGHGVGNFMEATQTIKDFGNSTILPVHNMYLWILCDVGIFGSVIFWGMVISAIRRLWQASKTNESIISCMSLAIITSIIVILVDGITNPLLREPMVFIIFWFFISFSVIFPEFQKMEREGRLSDDSHIT